MRKRVLKAFTLLELTIVVTVISVLLVLVATMYPKLLDYIRTKKEIQYVEDNIEAVKNLITTRPFSPAFLENFLYHKKDVYGMPFYYKVPDDLMTDSVCLLKSSNLFVCEIPDFDKFKEVIANYNPASTSSPSYFSCSAVGGELVEAAFVILSSGKNRNIQTPVLKLSTTECPTTVCYVVPTFKTISSPDYKVDWYTKVNDLYEITAPDEKWFSTDTMAPVDDRNVDETYDDIMRYLSLSVAKADCPVSDVRGSIDRFWADPVSISKGGTTTLYWIASLYGSSLDTDKVKCVLDFGDGSSEELGWEECIGFHSKSHTYDTTGVLVPTLKIFDDTGNLVLMKTTTLNVKDATAACSVSEFVAQLLPTDETESIKTFTAPANITTYAPATFNFIWNVAFDSSCTDRSCFIDFGDGTTSGKITDCSAVSSITHTYNKAGDFKAVLHTACGCDSPEFTISLPAFAPGGENAPPQIENFTVTPLYGTPPQDITISYTVRDANSDIASVKVLVDGQVVPSCTVASATGIPVATNTCYTTIKDPGVHVVTLVATDVLGAQMDRMVLVNMLGGLLTSPTSSVEENNYYAPLTLPTTGDMAVAKLTNPNDQDLEGYQIKLDALPIKDAFGLKFKVMTPDGEEVPYCFERENGECSATFCDSTDPDCSDPYDSNFWTGNIWVKAPEIPAGGESSLLIVPDDAYNAVDGDQVFDFYDDFNDGQLDDVWETNDNADNYHTITDDGKLNLFNDWSAGNVYLRTKEPVTPAPEPFRVDTAFTLTDGTGDGNINFGILADSEPFTVYKDASTAEMGLWIDNGTAQPQEWYDGKALCYRGDCEQDETLTPLNEELEATLAAYATYLYGYVEGAPPITLVKQNTIDLGVERYVAFVGDTNSPDKVISIDWVRIRKYAPEEPGVSLTFYTGAPTVLPAGTPEGCALLLKVSNLGDCDVTGYQFRLDISSDQIKSCISSEENPGLPSFIVCYGDECGDDAEEVNALGKVVGLPYCFEDPTTLKCQSSPTSWTSTKAIWVKIPKISTYDFIYVKLQQVPLDEPKNAVSGDNVFDFYTEQ